ncbi:zinc finger protein CONSTANS-LIKE 5 isoform X2 [Zea mays]|uniref:CCT domain-containing protein n=1 Tax=Zea mays TaxID=4577 RepID=A0A804LPB8_MAIZE|nr:zinc finger protein CONSTANS-LIKE 5 isoform X2 [Zea mays]|eukprot:XP_008659054.1 zinc finger protein CONSTANS-LIKE 5 isoform X2 [Zea mays]
MVRSKDPAIVPSPMASQLHAITHLSPSSSSGMASATSPSFRRALSTGDLIVQEDRDRDEEQRAVVAAATRYSAEERRERIDKYRSKRNQRNFQKKITYACRKTLADSRPRVKGRFARNGGDYTEADAVADHHVLGAAHQSESESESPATAATPEWWPAVQEELPAVAAAGINLAEFCADDDEMLAAYLGVSSISIADHHYSCQP